MTTKTNLPKETAEALYALDRLLHRHHAVSAEEAKVALSLIVKDVPERPIVFDVDLPGIERPPKEVAPPVAAETPAAAATPAPSPAAAAAPAPDSGKPADE